MLTRHHVTQLRALAKAMIIGARKRRQATGDLFTITGPDHDSTKNLALFKLGASCALGAAYEGAFGTPPLELIEEYDLDDLDYLDSGDLRVNGGDDKMQTRLLRQFPVLKIIVDNDLIPVDQWDMGSDSLSEAIVTLNDDRDWTRGKIAAWLRRLADTLAKRKSRHGKAH